MGGTGDEESINGLANAMTNFSPARCSSTGMGDVSRPPTVTQIHSTTTTAEPSVAMKRKPRGDPFDDARIRGADVTANGVEVITNGAEVIAGSGCATPNAADGITGA